ncbi:MAG: flagellin [Myxococcota bacterium]|nr:flagellin [Myxococcota bacterium]
MITLNNNAPRLGVQSQLRRIEQSTLSTLRRLSSGRRINGAADDAAGLSISSKMGAQLRSLTQVSKNINQGISYVQTAETGLSAIQGLLTRARELAVQAASGGGAPHERQMVHQEFQSLLQEINRIATVTESAAKTTPLMEELPGLFRIDNLFGTPGTTLDRQVSGLVPLGYVPGGTDTLDLSINSFPVDDDIAIFTRSGKHIAGTPLSDGVWTSGTNNITSAADMNSQVLTTANGFYADASYDDSELITSGSGSVNGMNITYTGEQQPTSNLESVSVVPVEETLIVFVIGAGRFDVTADWDGLGSNGAEINVTEFGDTLSVDASPSDTGTLNLDTSQVGTTTGAAAAIDAVDNAMQQVSAYRTRYGNALHALDIQSQRAAKQRAAMTTSRTRIADADMAEEASTMARTSIRKSLAGAMMAQTQKLQGLALNLIQNI